MPKYQIKMFNMPYDFNNLEPNISKETVYYNHLITKEYYQELKKVLDNHPEIIDKFPEDKIGSLNLLVSYYNKFKDQCKNTDNDKTICNDKKLQGNIRQFGGGLINQIFWFSILTKNSKFVSESKIGQLITNTFTSFKKFKMELIDAALSIFGSGWAWLVIDSNDKVRIYKTFNQDTPWFLKMTPLIAINIWEHAYFLQYKNNRRTYLEKILEILNWEQIERYYEEYLLLKNKNNLIKEHDQIIKTLTV